MSFLKVNCRLCKRSTNHDVLFEKHVIEDIVVNYFTEEVGYYVVQCRGCENTSFLYRYSNSQMFAQFEYDGEYEQIWDETVYPNDIDLRLKNEYTIKQLKYTPFGLKSLYEETVNNYRLGYYSFVAVGIRMIIEKLCLELDIKDGFLRDNFLGEIKVDKKGEKIVRSNLEGKINSLYDRGYILFKDLPVLQAIRIIGNEGVHEIKTPNTDNMIKAISVVEYVFETIYETKKFKELEEIRK